jgi:hypothetical protein
VDVNGAETAANRYFFVWIEDHMDGKTTNYDVGFVLTEFLNCLIEIQKFHCLEESGEISSPGNEGFAALWLPLCYSMMFPTAQFRPTPAARSSYLWRYQKVTSTDQPDLSSCTRRRRDFSTLN